MPVNRFSTEQGAQPTIFEMGAERKIGPELAHMAYDFDDVVPRSTKAKADGSAVIYLKYTPPPDLTCIRGAESYHEKLHMDYLPVKAAEEVNHWDGVGIVGKIQRNFDIPLCVEKDYGLKGKYMWHMHSGELIKRFGGIRQKAYERYQQETVRPFFALATAGLTLWTAVELYHRKWRSHRFFSSHRYLGGLPGAWCLWMSYIWFNRMSPAVYEVHERRLEDAKEFRKVLKDRKESFDSDWAEHKAQKGAGWWDNVPAAVPRVF
eukprot:TRINITY_DN44182_c0_g1_i1.p1 TRINITY_DN44182_c0_g1~~TRINITY_DN44182_c0_g1_i1.p1  ORF type:complete len:263 (-),score=51.19 TRINITY_DN44182_c0_g1_i1:206-994(-)